MFAIQRMQPDHVDHVWALWNAGCVEAVGTPLRDEDANRVRAVISKYPDQLRAHCFVAVQNGTVVGFITCAVLDHPVLFGLSGEIEELYVVPRRERHTIGAALVQQAVRTLQQSGASSIHVRVGTDEPRDKAFWRRLGWSNEVTIFSIYASVPGDPDLQHIWDSYQS